MISELEAAKYPFLKEAAETLDVLNLTLDDLENPGFDNVLRRAESRVSQAIIKGEVNVDLSDSLTELLSFPVANMYVASLGEGFLSRRYALSEAKRVSKLLEEENEAHIAKIARREFGWSCKLVRKNLDGRLHSFKLSFSSYLRNVAAFREPKWKLVNRLLAEGEVLATKSDVVRLLQEEVQRRIYGFLFKRHHITLPGPARAKVEALSKIFESNRPRLTSVNLPNKVNMEALPPCIKDSFEGLLAGKREGHMERFTLTSFLINIGMDLDEIIQLFISVTDFDEDFTRYQIEHIAGLRGGRTKYTPPTCSTLRTHNVCHNPDEICKTIKHPLSYYRRKASRRRLE